MLEKIYERARALGLRHPYLGNVYHNKYENTFCPSCGALLIERQGFASRFRELDGTQCGRCSEKIGIVTHAH
jgi:pyruvate formate lyase activating enzyme